MKFMAGHECDFPISWEFEIMFPLNYYSGSQNQECKKFYIAKARVPSQYEKIIISKSEKMHINLFTLYLGASHAMICLYLAKSDDQRYILQLLNM